MRLLLFFASSAAVIGLAAPAQADNADPNFVAALNKAGITFKSGSDVTGIGRRECQLMDQGHSEADVIKAMMDQNPGFTPDAATKFSQIAEQDLCPQHIGERWRHRRRHRRHGSRQSTSQLSRQERPS